MADVGTAIAQFLAADDGVSALVGDRIEPDALDQDATIPAITYYRVSTNHFKALSGPKAKLAQTRMTIDCFAATRLAANEISEAVRLSGILDLHGVTNGVDIRGVSVDNGQSHYVENPNDGGQARRYVTSTDYMISFKEEG